MIHCRRIQSAQSPATERGFVVPRSAVVTMPLAPRTACANRTCPNLRPCPDHARAAERARGTRQQRGYGRDHEKLREHWKPKVEAGLTRCARCRQPILLGQDWALDHEDDRSGYLGPSHAACNIRAAHTK
jgi:hypothetical protein